MPFQPLGYPFEVHSDEAPSAVKAKLRSGFKGWLDLQTGARGWIAGPLMCIWQSAYNQHGPMLLALIRHSGHGTIITGRAGSDLNGTLWLGILVIALAGSALNEQGRHPELVAALALLGLFVPLALWLAHSGRNEADDLVRFVERSLGARPELRGRSPRAAEAIARAGASEVPVTGATLEIVGAGTQDAPSAADIVEAIAALDDENAIILAFAEETYMQAACTQDGFRLEHRAGGADRHFRAAGEIGREAVAAAMLHYLATRSPSPQLGWEPVQL